MKEDDNIVVFSRKMRDIANEAFQLGETFSEKKLVRKTLRFLLVNLDKKLLQLKKQRT